MTTRLTNQVSQSQINSVALDQNSARWFGGRINRDNYYQFHNKLWNDNHSLTFDWRGINEIRNFIFYYYCSSNYNGTLCFYSTNGYYKEIPFNTNQGSRRCNRIIIDILGTPTVTVVDISSIVSNTQEVHVSGINLTGQHTLCNNPGNNPYCTNPNGGCGPGYVNLSPADNYSYTSFMCTNPGGPWQLLKSCPDGFYLTNNNKTCVKNGSSTIPAWPTQGFTTLTEGLQTLLQDGEYCTTSNDCVNANCNRYNHCGPEPPKYNDGQSCSVDIDCITNHCNSKKVCGPEPPPIIKRGEQCNSNSICEQGTDCRYYGNEGITAVNNNRDTGRCLTQGDCIDANTRDRTRINCDYIISSKITTNVVKVVPLAPAEQCKYDKYIEESGCYVNNNNCTGPNADVAGIKYVKYGISNPKNKDDVPCIKQDGKDYITNQERCTLKCPPKCSYSIKKTVGCNVDSKNCTTDYADQTLTGYSYVINGTDNFPCIDEDGLFGNKVKNGYIDNYSEYQKNTDCSYKCPPKCTYTNNPIPTSNAICNADTRKCKGDVTNPKASPGAEYVTGTKPGFFYPDNVSCIMEDNKIIYNKDDGKKSTDIPCSIDCPCTFANDPVPYPSIGSTNSYILGISDTCTKTCANNKTKEYGTISTYRPYESGSIEKCGKYSLLDNTGKNLPVAQCNKDLNCSAPCTDSGVCIESFQIAPDFKLDNIKTQVENNIKYSTLSPTDNISFYEQNMIKALTYFNNEYNFYVTNCNNKDGKNTIPKDNNFNPNNKNCNDLLSDIRIDASNIIMYSNTNLNLQNPNANMINDISKYTNDFIFYDINCRDKDPTTVPKDDKYNQNNDNCSKLANNLKNKFEDLTKKYPDMSAYKDYTQGKTYQLTTDYNNKYDYIASTYTKVLGLREDLDNKLRELYGLPNSKSMDYQTSFDSAVYSGIMLTVVATAVVYFAFNAL